MWIAKPLNSLSNHELQLALKREHPPLSQTLTWQLASLSLGAQVYLILDTQDLVGGFVHTFDGQNFDCTNGPLLSWDQPHLAPRHFATFAHAVSRLSSDFQSLNLAPRWESEQAKSRIHSLPIEPSEILEAATLQVPVEKTRNEQLQRATPRLRRTLSRAEKAGVQTEWSLLNSQRLREFVTHMQAFGNQKGFYVPSFEWFESLTLPNEIAQREGISFYLAEAWVNCRDEGRRVARKTQLLIAIGPTSLYYLFGCDTLYTDEPSPSTAASAHFRVLEECSRLGKTLYDLNGYTNPETGERSYRGVSLFKQQFGGEIMTYLCPYYSIS